MKSDYVVEIMMTEGMSYKHYFEVDMDAVLREKFAAGEGVLQLTTGIEDDSLLSLIKYAVAASNGQSFTVVPSEEFSSQCLAADDLPIVWIDKGVDKHAVNEVFAQGGGVVTLLDGEIDLMVIKQAARRSHGRKFRVNVMSTGRT